jgi:hypothetical protein
MMAALIGLLANMSPVFAMQLEHLSEGDGKGLYRVTCNDGQQHKIIADHAEQDFQYYYPDKGYYIKYYDIKFKNNNEFAEWVCRNK